MYEKTTTVQHPPLSAHLEIADEHSENAGDLLVQFAFGFVFLKASALTEREQASFLELLEKLELGVAQKNGLTWKEA